MTLVEGGYVQLLRGEQSPVHATVKELAPSSVRLWYYNYEMEGYMHGWFDLKTGKRLGDGDKQPYKFKVLS